MTPRRFNLIAKALADPQRVAILERIAKGEAGEAEVPCRAIVDEFDITPATISHHMKELCDAGLVKCRRAGKCAYFSAAGGVLDEFAGVLQARFGGNGEKREPRSEKRKKTARLHGTRRVRGRAGGARAKATQAS